MPEVGPTYACDQHGEPRQHPIAYRCPEWAAALEARLANLQRGYAELIAQRDRLRANMKMLEAALEKSAVLVGLMRERAEKAEQECQRLREAMTPPDDIREWVWSPRTKGWWALARPIGTRDALAIAPDEPQEDELLRCSRCGKTMAEHTAMAWCEP